jgi:hypothetical protein
MADLRVEVTLPSRGLPYKESEVCHISPLTAKEEKLVAGLQKVSQFADVVDEILNRCVHYAVPADDLISGDRLFLLFNIRSQSYGDKYGFELLCRRCDSQYRKEIEISKVPVRSLEDGWVEPFSTHLPGLNRNVKLRLFRGKDDRAVIKYVLQDRRIRSSRGVNETLPSDPGFFYRLSKHVVEIEGIENDKVLSTLEGMLAKDTSAIREAIAVNDCGYETEIPEECPHCGYEFDYSLEWSEEFFRPYTGRTGKARRSP